jgi:hypothetical protein
VQQLFLSVDDVTSGPEVAAVARVIKKSAIALSRLVTHVLHQHQVAKYIFLNNNIILSYELISTSRCAKVNNISEKKTP